MSISQKANPQAYELDLADSYYNLANLYSDTQRFQESEEMYKSALACAGSLLGLAFGHEGFSFPVGKVDHLNMYPLTFSEFLERKDAGLFRYYMNINTLEPLPEVFFNRLASSFNAYRITGGMPDTSGFSLISFA